MQDASTIWRRRCLATRTSPAEPAGPVPGGARGALAMAMLAALGVPAAGQQAPQGGPWLAPCHTDGAGRHPALAHSGQDAGRHAGAIMVATSAALAAYGQRKWWRTGFRSRFTATSEGWFGPATYSGGADKLGHLYMTYASARLLTRVFEWDGASHDRALRTAGWYTLGAYAAIEVLDGFSKSWRFSHEDMLMNAAGVGAAVVLERYPGLDRKLDLRLSYRPSPEGGRRFDPFGDYSGQTYLVVTRLGGFDAVPRTSWLRYVELAAGYGTRGFDQASGRHGRRNVYLGLSFNLSELLTAPGSSRERRSHAFARTALEFVQLPATSVMARHSLRPGAPDLAPAKPAQP